MARTKTSVHSKKRRRQVLNRAKGYYGNKRGPFGQPMSKLCTVGTTHFATEEHEKENSENFGFRELMPHVAKMEQLTVDLLMVLKFLVSKLIGKTLPTLL